MDNDTEIERLRQELRCVNQENQRLRKLLAAVAVAYDLKLKSADDLEKAAKAASVYFNSPN